MMGYPTGGIQEQANRARFSADIELSLLRPQIAENGAGRFRKSIRFSPRAILDGVAPTILEGRVRFWHSITTSTG